MADVTLDLRLNSQTFLADIANARSQAGMALGTGPGGMAGMVGGEGSGFGHTFTPSGMALNPHYGNAFAYTTTALEQQVKEHGLMAAQALKPPGVAPEAFALSVMSNQIERDAESRNMAQLGFRQGLWGTAAGLAGMKAGDLAGRGAGTMIGKVAGKALGLGSSLVGPLKVAGMLVGGYMGWDAAQGKVDEHFSGSEQIGNYTRELGDIAGYGRDLNRSERYELGIAARKAAFDTGMDANQMGDILAAGGAMNMLPTATDPAKARRQFGDFARTIEESAQVLGSSIEQAMRVIKTATEQGMTAREGVARAAGMGGAEAFGRYMAFGAQGAGVARSMGFQGGQGFSLFTGALGQMSNAGLSGEEMRIMGGRFGSAAFLGQTQMAVAASPMGRMQLMASLGGEELGNAFELPGQALAAMSQGGDLISNMIKFNVHEDEMRRGIGAKGIRTMARQQIDAAADVYMDQFDVSQNEARRFAAMQRYQMSGTQAKAYVGGLFRSGGGGGGYASRAREAAAFAEMQVTEYKGELPEWEGKGQGSLWGYVATGASAGASVGSIKPGLGTVIGAAIGAIGGAAYYAIGAGDDQADMFASKEERADFYQRKMATETVGRINQQRRALGIFGVAEGDIRAGLSADLGGSELSFLGNEGAAARVRAQLASRGIERVGAGPGTTEVGAGFFYSSGDVQAIAREPSTRRKVGRRTQLAAGKQVLEVVNAEGGEELLRRYYTMMAEASGRSVAGEDVDPESARRAGVIASRTADELESLVPGTKEVLQSSGGLLAASRTLGMEVRKMDTNTTARMLGAGVKAERDRVIADRESYLTGIFPSAFRQERPPAIREGDPTGSYYELSKGDRAFLTSKEWETFRSEAKKGNQEAALRAYTEGTQLYGAKGFSKIDPFQEQLNPLDVTAKTAAGVVQAVAGFSGAEGLEQYAKDVRGVASRKTTLAQEAGLAGSLPGAPGKGRKRGGGLSESAIGWGQTESALDLINKALAKTDKSIRRTHTMIKDLQDNKQNKD